MQTSSRIDLGIRPLGSKYLVRAPTGLRIDILSKGSCRVYKFWNKTGGFRTDVSSERAMRASVECRSRGVRREEKRSDEVGGGAENQNTRGPPVSGVLGPKRG